MHIDYKPDMILIFFSSQRYSQNRRIFFRNYILKGLFCFEGATGVSGWQGEQQRARGAQPWSESTHHQTEKAPVARRELTPAASTRHGPHGKSDQASRWSRSTGATLCRRWMRRSRLPRPWAAPQEGFVATATESGCRAGEGAGGSSSSAGRGGWMPSKSGSAWEVSGVPSCPSPRARGRAPVHPQTTAETSLGRVCQR